MSKILLVDDDAELQEAVGAVLTTHGYDVIYAPNGSAGYQMAVQEKPDLILLDVMMAHDSEGFEIARQLHESPDTAGIPVIIITGIRKAKGLPFKFEPDEDWLPEKAVLEKPVKPEALLVAVAEAISGSSSK